MAQVDRDGVITGARVVARGTVDRVLALPGFARSAARCCCTTIPAAVLEPSGAGPRRRGAAARRRHRLRHHRQRRDRALRRGRGAARPAGPSGSIPSTSIDTLGEGGPVARAARPLRGPPQPARHGGPHRRRLQRRRRAAARGRHRGRQVARLSGARAALGRARTASAPSCPPTRSTCRSSSSARICRCSRARSATASTRRRSRCSRDGATISASRGWSRRSRRSGRCSRQDKLDELTAIARWAGHTADGSLERSAGHAHRRGVGRGERRGGPVHAAQVQPLRPLLSVSGAPARGARPTSSWSTTTCSPPTRGAPGARKLGGRGGAAGLPAAGPRRGAPPRGRRGRHTSASR